MRDTNKTDVPATENTARLTPDEYAKDHGARCPVCLSNDIEGGAFEADAFGAWRRVRCLSCGAEWDDTYKLTGYDMPRHCAKRIESAAQQQWQAAADDMGGFTSDTAALAFLLVIGNGNPNVERAVRRLRSSLLDLAQQLAVHPASTHCDNCGCDWLDNGLNPVGCPYCKQQPEARGVVDGWKLVVRYGEYDKEPGVWAEKDGSYVWVAALTEARNVR